LESHAPEGRLLLTEGPNFSLLRTGYATSVRDIEGTRDGRFRRALDQGNALAALSAAGELPNVGITDALELVVLREKAPEKFGRAGLRDRHDWARGYPGRR
jgi:hypothetical protein